MKTFIFTIFFLTILFSLKYSWAQKSHNYGGFSGSVAFPIKYFSSNSKYDKEAGFAKIGFASDAIVIVSLSDYFGFAFQLHYQSHFVDVKALKEQASPNISNLNVGNWEILGLLAGLNANILTEDKFDIFNIKVIAGYFSTLTPSINYSINNNYFSQAPSSCNSLGIIFGAGLNFKLSEKVKLLFNVNMLNTTAKIKTINTIIIDYPGAIISDNEISKQKINSLNFEIAILLSISKKTK